MKKLKNALLIIAVFYLAPLFAGEGMWLPLLLQQFNEADMQSMGMKMTAEDIYSVNQGSLKDAVVHFGGFCTGEVISDQGLMLTNHHCGYRQIQSHSSMEANYLENGFWAANQSEELPNPGLFAKFIVRMKDVTDLMLEGVKEKMDGPTRQAAIAKNEGRVLRQLSREEYQDVEVKSFYSGNQYFAFITETYNDVRLVGAPPSSVGKFGADTDNWVWPRHTGDFSLFRIYAGPDNKPAAYSPNNKPLRPRHSLPVSLDGVASGDFTLVFGFPGRTRQYLPAIAVEQEVELLNPVRIDIRTQTLEVLNAAMQSDPAIKLQYASKQSGISNAWKKWIGVNQGIKRTGGIAAKKEFEEAFTERIQKKRSTRKAYRHILPQLNELYEARSESAVAQAYVSEIAGRNVELFRLANTLRRYVKIYHENGEAEFSRRIGRVANYLEGYYKDYRPEIDEDVFAKLIKVYLTKVDEKYRSPYVESVFSEAGKDYDKLAKLIYEHSVIAREDDMLNLINGDAQKFVNTMEKDPGYQLLSEILDHNNKTAAQEYDAYQKEIEPLERAYMAALLDVFPDKKLYPDANSTMRVTYGQVKGYEPRDAVMYQPITHLSGVMQKYVPGDYEFDVSPKLRELYDNKDYGDYATKDGKMPVCFIGTNHTSGGNSGSPAIDAHGNLIGLNFDRAWEGTMSDFYYDPSICRNIMVDIRYILFQIDKVGGAKWIVDEMNLVHPKN